MKHKKNSTRRSTLHLGTQKTKLLSTQKHLAERMSVRCSAFNDLTMVTSKELGEVLDVDLNASDLAMLELLLEG